MNGAIKLASAGEANDSLVNNISAMKIMRIELIFVAIFVVDVLVKIYYQVSNIRNRDGTQCDKNANKETYDKQDGQDTQLSSSSGKSKEMEKEINYSEDPRVQTGVLNSYIFATEIFFNILLIVLFVLERYLIDFNYVELAIIFLLRLILRLPFLGYLIAFQIQCRRDSLLMNIIYPKTAEQQFSTYKDKVLFILNKTVNQLGKNHLTSNGIVEILWCAFVIENGYLSISNSISSSSPANQLITPLGGGQSTYQK